MNKYLLFLWVFLWAACVDDNGNYDYVSTRELALKNIKRDYDLTVGESQVLIPEIILKGDVTETLIEGAKFEWLMEGQVVSDEPVFTYQAEKNGLFYGLLRVTDPLTGAVSLFEFKFNVLSPYDRGFLILAEKDGKAQLSCIRSKWTTEPDTVVYTDEFVNVFSKENGEELKGLPYALSEHWKYDNGEQNGELTLITQDGQGVYVQELNGKSLKRETWIGQEFEQGVLPKNCRPRQVMHTCWDSFILDESGVVYIRRSGTAQGFHTGYFSDKITLWNNQKFERLFLQNMMNWKLFWLWKSTRKAGRRIMWVYIPIITGRKITWRV
ncbi:MAG: PKD-like family lipoprotein [Odoribacter splanchnicus]